MIPAAARLTGVSLVRAGRAIVDEVALRVDAGSVTALVGPNGAGKSTLLHLIASAETPSAGTIELGGRPLTALSRRERARRTALVEQQADTDLDLTVSDVVLLGRVPHTSLFAPAGPDDGRIAQDALVAVGADALAPRRYQELSGGERQRVLLARALAQQPRLLLVDEPTNHLDVHAQLRTLDTLRTLAGAGIAVLAALHDLNLAIRYADEVIVLDAGRVVATGRPLDVLTPDLIRTVYGVRADLTTHPADGRPLIAFSTLDTPATPATARAELTHER